MKILSSIEVDEVSGGLFFMPFLIGSLCGLGSYALNKYSHKELMSYEGAAAAAGIGGITGGASGALVSAAGGGIAGSLAWRPGFMFLNGIGQNIVAENS